MAKFEVNDIVWVKRNNQSPEPYYWPAKIIKVVQPKLKFRQPEDYEISLFTGGKNQVLDSHTLLQNEQNLLPFDRFELNQRNTSINQYLAYHQARKQHAKAMSISSYNESEDNSQDNSNIIKINWTKRELMSYLQGLLDKSLTEQEEKFGIIACSQFQVTKQESQFYLKQHLSQILCYLIHERELNSSMKTTLTKLKQNMKTVIVSWFMNPDEQ